MPRSDLRSAPGAGPHRRCFHCRLRAPRPHASPCALVPGCGVVASPAVPEGGAAGYLSEDQARDYPESHYERDLQVAVESKDQRALDRLLSRRSSTETLRLALLI